MNERDVQTGTMEKMEAHLKGFLHRAFSIFIFNSEGEFLLQKRAKDKYHNGGLWTNTCCSHPLPGEAVLDAANRRLMEEMGFSTLLTPAFSFTYKASFTNGLTEHEFDHVFTGIYDGKINVDESEVSDYCFKNINDIELSLQTDPHKYTEWFKIALLQVVHLQKLRFSNV